MTCNRRWDDELPRVRSVAVLLQRHPKLHVIDEEVQLPEGPEEDALSGIHHRRSGRRANGHVRGVVPVFDRCGTRCTARPCGAESTAAATPATKTQADRAWKAEAGIGEGGVDRRRGRQRFPPWSAVLVSAIDGTSCQGVLHLHAVLGGGQPTTRGHETWVNLCCHPPYTSE
jgi:hypothetical protein